MRNLTWKSAARTAAILLALVLYAVGAFSFSRHTSYYNLYGLGNGDHISFDKAQVISVDSQSVTPDKRNAHLLTGTQNLTIRMLTGEYKGRAMKLVNGLNYDTNYLLAQSEKIIVSVNTAGKGQAVHIYLASPDRGPLLYLMIGLFAICLCCIGGRQGFHSVIGIAFTLISVIFLFIPLLYRGFSPALAALILSGMTACVTLLLAGGWSAKTLSAILGTVGGVALSAGLLRIFESVTSLSGYTMPDYDSMLAIAGHSGLRVDELLFAAIVISSLGAVMDIAISVAACVNEVYLNNPQYGTKLLFSSGMRVGRDMMGTMSNTLILAFTGSSLNMLILIYTYNMNYLQIINANTIAIEIVQAVSGSLAVIFTVPLVSIISAKLLPLLARRSLRSAKEGTAALKPAEPESAH